MLVNLHYEDYLPHLNSQFELFIAPETSLPVELIKVEDNSGIPQQEQFVLTFQAPSEMTAGQGLYPMTHAELGSGEIFLVPIAKNEEGLVFEAIFNRLRQEAQNHG